ncbi:flagellar biosynthetic protein FliO [Magnetovibrio sp.]|uniref:flagellar biosynthetic protein FliO n=1 Tax=Magnetovibrio sp. TaxID=2024836 RepID=UPI002F92D667
MDLGNYLRFVFALLFVLGLIGVLSVLVRRYGFGMSTQPIRKGQDRRLSLVEILPIDTKRRAILLRRDSVEHLIILGPDSETVVESSIAPPPVKGPAADTFTEALENVAPQGTKDTA